MYFRCDDQRQVTVYASEECEVCRKGRHVRIVGVVHLYLKKIVTGFDKVRDIEAECAVTAGVLAGFFAVDACASDLIGTLEMQEDGIFSRGN